MDDSLSDASSEEDMTPLMRIGKRNFIAKNQGVVDSTPQKGLVIGRRSEDLKLIGSSLSVDQEKIIDHTPKILESHAESERRFALNKFYSSDNSDEEESPLAALASRHLKNKVVTSGSCSELSFSVEGEEFATCTEIDNFNKTEVCEADSVEEQQRFGKLSQRGSASRKKGLFERDIPRVIKDCNLNEDERNSDDSIYSPLVTLANKYLKVEDVCENSCDCKLEECGSSSDCVETLISYGETQEQNDKQVYCPLGRISNIPKLLSNPPDIGVSSTSDKFLMPFVSQINKIHEEEKSNSNETKEECISASKEVRSSEDFRECLFNCDILANKEVNTLDHKQASSLSDLAFHHLSKSASSRIQSDKQFIPKKFHSDTGISKSVPSGFVIPFLSKSENYSFSSESKTSGENLMEMSEVQGVVESNVSAENCDDWVIDLTGALRDPELRIPHKTPDTKFSTTIIHIDNTEFQEESVQTTTCHLDASEILKMKFSYSKKRCSPFGRVVCRAWRHLSGPYIPHTKQIVRTVTHFSFDEPSPDDSILIHLREKT